MGYINIVPGGKIYSAGQVFLHLITAGPPWQYAKPIVKPTRSSRK